MNSATGTFFVGISPARALAKLTEQTPKFDTIGGRTDWDQATCAALCGHLPRRYYLAARLKWCLDASVITELTGLLLDEALKISEEEKWKVGTGGRLLSSMCRLACAELAKPHRLTAQQQRAMICGIRNENWRQHWQARYEVIYRTLDDWTAVAWRHMRKQQRNR